MLKISLRQLEVFVAAVDCNSFTIASERLYLTQSTVSAHISALEQALGMQLILRGARRKFTLTANGQRVYLAARDIIEQSCALQENVPLQGGEISLASSTVPTQYLLPMLVAGYSQICPEVHFSTKRGDSAAVHAMLARGESRLGLVGTMHNDTQFEYHVLVQDKLVLISENSAYYAQKLAEGFSGLSFLNKPIIARDAGSGTQREVDSYLQSKSIPLAQLHIIARMDDPELIKNSVAQGLGVSILSHFAVKEQVQRGQLLEFPLQEDGPYRALYLAWRKDAMLCTAERNFIRYAQLRCKGK